MNWEVEIDTYTTDTMYKTDKQGEPTVLHKELYSTLCGDLTNGKEIQKSGDRRMADSLCCTAENNTTL